MNKQDSRWPFTGALQYRQRPRTWVTSKVSNNETDLVHLFSTAQGFLAEVSWRKLWSNNSFCAFALISSRWGLDFLWGFFMPQLNFRTALGCLPGMCFGLCYLSQPVAGFWASHWLLVRSDWNSSCISDVLFFLPIFFQIICVQCQSSLCQ